MVKLAYHCSMEQFTPKELLHYAIQAERSGFKHLSCSDHFAPWSHSQGQSGNAWCWMGAVLSATQMTCGPVCSPAYRYNPAVVAQMAATLGELFPGRFWLALGSGEYVNEQFIGQGWPPKKTRNEILQESVEVIRQLLAGNQVTTAGHLKIETAKLYTLAKEQIPLLGAALSEETARYLALFTDGLITVGPFDKVKKVIEAYREYGGAQKKLILKLDVSYARTKEQAIELGWQEWRYTQLDPALLADLRYPEQFEEEAKKVTKEAFAEKIIIAQSTADVEAAIQQFTELGVDQINLHNVNKEQEAFIAAVRPLLGNYK